MHISTAAWYSIKMSKTHPGGKRGSATNSPGNFYMWCTHVEDLYLLSRTKLTPNRSETSEINLKVWNC